MISIRKFRSSDLDGVIKVIETIPDWFDEDARKRAIPIDLDHQIVFVAERDEIVGFISNGSKAGFRGRIAAFRQVNAAAPAANR